MILVNSIQTTWQATAPWYKTGLVPVIEIINNWIDEGVLNTNETGLIFLCEDGGYDACIDLWKAAVEQGVRFVNPAPFPYSLSSSPAGFVAKACGIYGPVIVLVENETGLSGEEINVLANNIFLQEVKHLFIVKAMLYNHHYQYKAMISWYDSKMNTSTPEAN